MKRLSKKKLGILIAVILLVGGAAAGYFLVLKKDSGPQDSDTVSAPTKEKKVQNLFTYVSEEGSLSDFNAFLTSGTDLAAKVTANAAGALPQYILFAPSNEAFADAEVAPLAALAEPLKDELRQYHMVLLFPDANGTAPSLELTEGQRLSTVSGRELLIKKAGKKLVVVDAKGREAEIRSDYAVSDNGDRLYFIDKVLLLQ